ncbi:MAG: ATPase [Coxiella sp. DG_40]|nr:MAG: ATPase [Coxiella sp. DG_40]
MNDQLNLATISGISDQKAAKRLKQEGYNELPSIRKRGIFKIVSRIVTEPMFLLLIAGGILYFILGDAREALVLISFVFVIMGITFYQEHKSERALDALRKLSSPRALVIRDGKEMRIPGREVVREDIVAIHEGDFVPADCRLILSNNLTVDESLLTGESVPVYKIADKEPNIYAGTLVVGGNGIAEVYGTGINTEMGKIGKSLQVIKPERTSLQKATARLVRNLAIIGLSVCVLVAVIHGYNRGDWLHGTLAGITLAMAILPEEFPVILTTFLALGTWRISREHVLTRQIPAVEALGSTTVLCVDKTGTLTKNEMQVNKIFVAGKFLDLTALSDTKKPLPENFHDLIEYSILASQRDPFDPMEKAIKRLGDKYLQGTEHLHKDWQLVREYPLSKNLLAISHVWKSPYDTSFEIAAKGAPEAIIDLCHINKTQAEELLNHIKTLASEGLRVLGVAKAQFQKEVLPLKQHEFEFKFIGLIGLADPIRLAVPEAIQKCHQAGIRVIMITGDYSETAINIAKQIGLDSLTNTITGQELQDMSEAELCEKIKNVNIFARIVPEQKLRIVNALKANNEIVAMTGDGVNDAPALKSAHIGIAMGERGTDVARETAELVLLNDDFSSIVQAVSLGRRIFDNIRKAMTYTFSVHIPIIGMSLLPVIFRWPLILLPIHIVFLELIIDPACSIVFEAEPEEIDVMQRKPRDPKESVFNWQILKISLIQGCIVLLIVLVVFGFGYYFGYNASKIRALTFTTLVIGNLSLIFSNRSWSRNILASLRLPNPALWWIVSCTLIFLGVVLYIPFLHGVFHFNMLNLLDLVICLIAGILCILCFELLKIFNMQKKYALYK